MGMILGLRVSDTCPHCSSDRVFLINNTYGASDFFRCVDCLLAFQWPQPSEADVSSYYEKYLTEVHQESFELNNKRLKAYEDDIYFLERSLILINKEVRHLKICYDYGASGGFLLDMLRERGLLCRGWDYGLEAQSLQSQKGYLLKPEDCPFKERPDLLILRGVIEHMADPCNTVGDLTGNLNPDYILISATPNGSSAAYSLLGEKWGMHIPIEHLWQFSLRHIIDILAIHGFIVINYENQYINGPYADPIADAKEMYRASLAKQNSSHAHEQTSSPAFFYSMMTVFAVKSAIL